MLNCALNRSNSGVRYNYFDLIKVYWTSRLYSLQPQVGKKKTANGTIFIIRNNNNCLV